MKNTLVAVALFGVLAGVLPAHPLRADLPQQKVVEEALESRIRAGAGVGYMVGMIEAERTMLFGVGDTHKDGDTLSNEHLFEIGSISKTFTGILLADMILRGEVSLDDPVARYLPGRVQMPEYEGQPITLRHLVTHSSGLPRLPDNLMPADQDNPYADYSFTQMYRFLSRFKLTQAPGSTTVYSNLGMGLLGHALERRAEMDYEDLVHERILKPLGMQDTRIQLSMADRRVMTKGHDQAGRRVSWWDIPTLAGAGALRSSGRDMMIYMRANLFPDESPIGRAIALSHQPLNFYREGGGWSVGMGWFVFLGEGGGKGTLVWHSGGTGGFRSHLAVVKEAGKGAFVLANSQDDVDQIARSLLKGTVSTFAVHDGENGPAPDAAALARYTGEYMLAPNFTLTMTQENGKLYTQATGQQRFQLYATGENRFELRVVEAALTFQENEAGEIEVVVLHQGGRDQLARKLTEAERAERAEKAKALQQATGIQLSEADLKPLVGDYQLAPGVLLMVRIGGDHLMVQVTGQPALPVFATSGREFFYKAVEASLTFVEADDGSIEALILHQNGNHRAVKIN